MTFIAVVFLILACSFILKISSSQGHSISGKRDFIQSTPVKIDFILFNSDGLKCKDGQVVNCNIIIHGFSNETFSRELIHEQYIKVLQRFSLEKDPDWFFSERNDCHDLFLAEFGKMNWPIIVESLVIAELSYADECFTDKAITGEYEEQERARCKKEIEGRISQLEEERDLEGRKLEAERGAALRKIEEENAAAIARLEEENRLIQEKLEKEYQEAIKREEELNKENN